MSTDFGSELREYRRQARLSQRELAKEVGVDFSYISKLENGRLPPPAADTIVKICGTLEIKPEILLALTGKIPTDVKQIISSSKKGQELLRELHRMELTDIESDKLMSSLKNLRDE